MQILSARQELRCCFGPGVGKTAWSRAWRRGSTRARCGAAEERADDTLDLAALVAACSTAASSNNVRTGDEKITERGDIILFIDELHTWSAPGAAEGHRRRLDPQAGLAAANCNDRRDHAQQVRQYLERDSSLERDSPRSGSTAALARERSGSSRACASATNSTTVTINDEALAAAAELADRYNLRPLPARQGDRPDRRGRPADADEVDVDAAVYRELRRKSRRRAHKAAIEAQELEEAANLRDTERQLTTKRELEDEWAEGENGERPVVGEEEVADIVSMWTGIPVSN